LGLAACGSRASTAPGAAPAQHYYVSIGDSYAAGFQPTGRGVGHDTTNGYAYQLVGLAATRGYHLTLVNFGCDGATTASLLDAKGCSHRAPGAPAYPGQSQAAAAEQFLTQHRGDIDLVTVSVGGNDVTRCAKSTDAIACVGAAITTIKTRLAVLLPALRSAAGPSAKIVGLTYPDVILGGYLSSSPSQKSLATLSTTAFKSLINPALQAQYDAIGASFVDVTTATGAYLPFSQTTDLAPYGTIPTAVAKICQLTYYCQYEDIHPRTPGYQAIATLIAATLPLR
ncbi:MAG TPA: GDSL-type esterase/lipase family protein, partial [Mycobacteriales bacterium]